ncbi:hypothetical protein [Variovorax paradoxus]|jgi:hypothetical protein|uniref:hypothetical protein n=1 Tax=Variovorax paradoxus TaxID=34073 RepID=UPI003D6618EB
MSSIDVNDIGIKMLVAAEGVLKNKWVKVKPYIESETKIFAERLANIARLRAAGSISEQRARDLVAFQKEAFETVLLAVEGLTQLAIEEALNAALKAVRDAVNVAVGFVLL